MKPKVINKPKEDCFAYKNSNTCNALTEMVCLYKDCPFYKKKSDVDYKAICAINRK
jgi:hypothetical protein